MRTRLLLLSVASLLVTTTAYADRRAPPPPTVAPPPPEPTPAERASKIRDDGNAAMLTMRYADGLDAYQRALALTPDDLGLVYSIARAQQFLGDFPGALTSLDTFVAKASDEMKAKVGKLDELVAQIRARVGTLVLTSSESGARVIVRDKIVGVTPLPPMRLPAGASTLQIELDGFFTETREINLPGGGELAITVPLHRKSSSGMLGIQSDPFGASIKIDGRDLGTSSPRLEVALPAGPHEIYVHHDGYDDAKLSLLLSPGATRDVSVPLEKSRSVVTRWWFWTAAGAAIAGGIVLGVALSTEKGAGHGTLSPGQVGGP